MDLEQPYNGGYLINLVKKYILIKNNILIININMLKCICMLSIIKGGEKMKFKVWLKIILSVFLTIGTISWAIAPTPIEAKSMIQPRVVVKFKETINIPYQDGAEQFLDNRNKSSMGWGKFGSKLKLKRLFTSVDTKRIKSLQQQANKNINNPKSQIDLLQYFVVDVPKEVNAQKLAKQFRQSNLVEIAYVEGTPVQPPSVNSGNDPLSINQGYLNPAPTGIDAKYIWNYAGGDGYGVTVTDLEQGWNLSHEDLVAQKIQLISGVNKAYHSHGTSVLGELVSTDNTVGTVGIVPNAKAKVVSQWRTHSTYSTADAILSATQNLSAGDVLLLEAQTTYPTETGYLPVEVEDAVFDAIRLATNKGVTVVEAAGNGSNDLDSFKNLSGKYILNRSSSDFRDSGAIMVGASSSSYPHSRLYFSNYGSRIDCYGWGQNVTTTSGNIGQNTSYTYTFGGTSGASPIIAGAVAAVQGITKAKYGGYTYSPSAIRNILTYSSFSTPSASTSDKIGRMPNLKAISQYILQLGTTSEKTTSFQKSTLPQLPENK